MTLSLGTLVALPLTLLAATAFLFLARWLLGHARKTANRHGEAAELKLFGSLAQLVAALLVVVAAIGMWPYEGEYHTWRTATGTVSAIDSRMVAADKAMTQRFVVTFTDGRQRACDDTRCATLKPGDRLTLKCKRAYQWGSTHGYDCNWISKDAR